MRRFSNMTGPELPKETMEAREINATRLELSLQLVTQSELKRLHEQAKSPQLARDIELLDRKPIKFEIQSDILENYKLHDTLCELLIRRY